MYKLTVEVFSMSPLLLAIASFSYHNPWLIIVAVVTIVICPYNVA